MKRAQRGFAVVLAMGVAALAAIAAAAMISTQSVWARQNELMAGHVQAQALVRAGADWACAILAEDRRASNVDHRGEPWALRLKPVPIESGELVGALEDEQGAFNLNNLVIDGKASVAHLANFQRLLAVLDLPGELADALTDWLDADGVALPQGAEDNYYLARNPPYLAANRPLTDLSELALVRGFDQTARMRLRPYVTALPQPTPVNVNTAAPEVLAAIVEGLSLIDARALVARRDRSFFRDMADFRGRLPAGVVVAADHIAVRSDFFTASMRATIGEAQASGRALISRVDPKWPVIVWRKVL
jgi:general secretion pathway protein K